MLKEMLGCLNYVFRSEKRERTVRVHENRLQKIGATTIETAEPKDSVFSDGLRILRKITELHVRRNEKPHQQERHFKYILGAGGPRGGHQNQTYRKSLSTCTMRKIAKRLRNYDQRALTARTWLNTQLHGRGESMVTKDECCDSLTCGVLQHVAGAEEDYLDIMD